MCAHQAYLASFLDSFDFGQLTFDVAIRVTLESFRLPGEAQKIDRIMEAFAHQYFEGCQVIMHDCNLAYNIYIICARTRTWRSSPTRTRRSS